MSRGDGRDGRRRTAGLLAAVVVGMVGMSFAAVPLYDLFCRVTGYGGTPARAALAPGAETEDRVTVRFDAGLARGMPWVFRPVQREVEVALGERALAFYRAHNPTSEPVKGIASFNVLPFEAGAHFSKIECFCFVEQTLAPGETVEMPVAFFVDPAIREDPEAAEVSEITLSYTFFVADG